MSVGDSEVESSAIAGITVKANATLLVYIDANGLSKGEKAGMKTMVIKKAMTLNTSYYDTSGRKVWHMKRYNKGHKFFFHDGGWHDGPCDNDVVGLPGGPKKAPKGHIQITGKVQIVPKVSWSATAKAKAWSYDKATAEVSCDLSAQGGSKATASASASGYAEAYARATAKGKTKAQAEANAKIAANQAALNVDFQLGIKGTAKANAEANAQTEAQAKATVSCSVPPTTPPTPPNCQTNPNMPECVPTPKPILLDVTQVNDLEINWETQICAEYNVAQGRSALLKFAPFYGTIVGGPSSFTVTGHDTKCVTLKASSEVPTGDTQAGIPAGKDRVTYTLTDTASGDSATPMSSDYRTYEPAVHPG